MFYYKRYYKSLKEIRIVDKVEFIMISLVKEPDKGCEIKETDVSSRNDTEYWVK